MKRILVVALCAALVPLAACSKDDSVPGGGAAAGASAVPTEADLATAIGKEGTLSTTAKALREAGLDKVFEGKGAYTVLAPTDAAFAALGDKAGALEQPEQRAALAAMLREHMVPGYLTPTDLGKALDAAKGAPVKMRTVGNGSLSFTREGGVIRVTAPDGSSAALGGNPVLARNGVAIPIDRVLAKL